MRKIAFILALCLCLVMVLGACQGRTKEASYSLVVRNNSPSEIVLKRVTVNDRDYVNQRITLMPLTDKTAGGEYWAAFTSGSAVKVVVVLEDSASGQEFTFADKVIDNAGDGFVITLEYNSAGNAELATSTMGRLSAWGRK